ncbi:CHAT domain-containing protein [Maribacter algarum]|uniref:CHAT domain-containing protein n=1 Tax=Maribacter algarum (ex Zhang et al. 2020) TaxID=2578118 RepID=A0A5S3PUR2_9FLAO|nr:CHAT domain-containing tetratricopeptide repeat protein [Maribacter algarum]TMM58756.1 CHAT domain-containing protein [Maribacter algarum]
MRRSCFYLLLLFFCQIVFAQKISDKQNLANTYFEKGLEFRYDQKDSSYFYLDLAREYNLELKNYSQALDVILESIFASGIHYDLKTYKSNLDKMEAMLLNYSSDMTTEEIRFYENRFIYEEGSYYEELKNYVKAKSRFQKLHDIYSKKNPETLTYNDLSFLIYSTNLLASIYMDIGKFDIAENYFNKALTIIEKNELAKKEGFDRSTNRLLAQLYINIGKHEKADEILQELLYSYKNLYSSDKEYKNSLVVVYQRLVDNYIKQDSLQKAIYYLDESQEFLIENDPFYKQSLLLYGDILLKQDKNIQALEYYNDALRFYLKYRNQKPHQEVAKVQGRIAEFYLKQGDYKKGLKAIKEALGSSRVSTRLNSVEANPEPGEVFSKRQLLYLLDIKSQLLYATYEKQKDESYLTAATNTNKDILSTFNVLKKEFDSKLDKQFLAENVYPIFHRMFTFTYENYQVNKSKELLQLAIDISEKNKDFLLLEALRSTQASKYANIPEAVLNKEAQLRAEITYFEKEIFDAGDLNDDFSESLFVVKQEYYSFLDSVKLHYPKYHSLKYQSTSIDLGTIRRWLLKDRGTLVSYTLTDNHLYTVVVNDEMEKFLKIPFSDSDRQMIRVFYTQLSSPSVRTNEKSIPELGKKLFKKLLKTPLTGLNSKNLIVIPDGELHYLPFDMLIKDEAYLLETVNISYSNSIASLIELKQKQNVGQKNVLAFAPSFKGLEQKTTERDFGKLLYNDDEIQRIGSYYETEVYSDSTAILENFMSFAPNQNIIHLATHATANDEYPDYSYLAFSANKDSTRSNILYIKDLYNMSLNADMVTLSACQTGIGKLQKGQGMMSLSKGFYYAGAKSLVNTLWKINDKSTVKLMEYFYEGLSKGHSKSEALRKAKLKYLETTEDEFLKHPYYWAAFVVSGDVSPISNSNTLWWVVGVGMFSLLILIIFSKKGKDFRKTGLQK